MANLTERYRQLLTGGPVTSQVGGPTQIRTPEVPLQTGGLGNIPEDQANLATGQPSRLMQKALEVGVLTRQPLVAQPNAFGVGFKSGIRHPFQFIVGQSEELERSKAGIQGAEKLPYLAGELIGMGISSIPFWFGGGWALRGVGLTRQVSTGIRAGEEARRAYITSRTAQGAVAFGAFEAGASTELSEVPGNLLFGATLGAAGELAFAAFAARKMRASYLPPTIDQKTIKQGTKLGIHPDVLRLEMSLFPTPNSSVEEIAKRLNAIGDQEAQLVDIASRFYEQGVSPVAIIPGIKKPTTFKEALTKNYPDVEVSWRKGDDGFEVMLARKELDFTWEKVKDSMLRGDYDYNDVADMIRKGSPQRPGLPVTYKDDGSFGSFYSNIPAATRINLNHKAIADRFGAGAAAGLRTMGTATHELIHYLHYLKTPIDYRRSQGRNAFISLGDFLDFGPWKSKPGGTVKTSNSIQERVASLIRRETGMNPSSTDPADSLTWADALSLYKGKKGEAFGKTPEGIMLKEILDTLEANLTDGVKAAHMFSHGRRTLTDFDHKQIKKIVEDNLSDPNRLGTGPLTSYGGGVNYFMSDHEILSNLMQLMVVNPRKAKEVAPRMSQMLMTAIEPLAPDLKQLVNQRAVHFHNLLELAWTQGGVKKFTGMRKIFPTVKQHHLRQFEREGGFHGMGVLHNGNEQWTWVKTLGDKVRIKNQRTREVKDVLRSEVQRPVFPEMAERSAELMAEALKVMKTPPTILTGKFMTTIEEAGAVMQGVTTLSIDTRHYLQGYKSIGDYLRKHYDEIIDAKTKADLQSLKKPGSSSTWTSTSREAYRTQRHQAVHTKIAGHLRDLGHFGLVFNDNGNYSAFVAVKRSLLTSGIVDHPSLHRPVNKSIESITNPSSYPWEFIEFSFDEVMENALKAQGLDQHQTNMMLNAIYDSRVDQLVSLMDPEFQQIYHKVFGAKSAIDTGVDSAEDMAARLGYRLQDNGGDGILLQSAEYEQIASFVDMDDAKSYLGALAPEGAPELSSGVGELSSVFSGPSGSPGVPAKFQEPLPTVTGLERLAAGAAFFTPFFTARENVFKAMQNLGLGPTYSRIFKPIQEAINRVEYEMATVVRPELGGMSINKYLDKLQNKVFKVDKNRRKQLIDATEFLTKNEVAAPGGFMPRGMNTLELSVAKQMEAFNLQGKLAPLLGSMRLARNILDSKEKFIKNYQKAIKEGRMTPEMQARWDKIYEDGETFKTVGDVYDALGLSIEERWAVEEMANGLKRKADDFSLAAVIRYTEAPELKSGFKTGREQFFSEHNFNPLEKKIVADIDQLLAFGFDRAGLDSKRQIGGYFPHFRKMVQQGFTTDDAWLKRDMPEFLNWIHERFRTGEINVYSKDPVLDSLRYMRGLLMKEHFDPILPEIKAARELIKAKDLRAGRLVDDYIDQAIGKPHVSFQKMQGWIQSAANAMGKNVPQHLVEDVVNNLVMLSYGATIPFRPALIARNWFQAVQTIPARTGWSSFMEGVQRAGTKEGWEELVKSGVIPRDQVPIFATSEIWRPGQLKLTRDLQRLVDRGFKWYKTPDDYGRAMAYFAQKSRVSKHMDDVMQGKIDYETFKQRAKIKTFDPMDEAMFDSYWAAGERDRAIDHVAASLARETHFRYGHANNPSGWNGVAGRLFGQFGTWPVQYKDFIVTGLTRGTTKDKAEFLMNIVGTNYGVVAAGAAVGLNLNNWINFSSLTYTGGPFAQMAVDLVKTQSGSDVEKRLARTNLIRQFPTWDDPRSLFVPGSYLLGDIMAGLEEPSLGSGLVRATGIRFLRPEDKTAIDWLLGR